MDFPVDRGVNYHGQLTAERLVTKHVGLQRYRVWEVLPGSAKSPDADQVVDLPPIAVRLRTSPAFKPFERMLSKALEQHGNELFVTYGTADSLIEFRFFLPRLKSN